MNYYDIHAHHPAIDPEDVTIINRIIGNEKEENSFSGQWCSVGIHPWYIYNNVQGQFLRLESAVLCPSVVAVGEAGLDKLSETPLDIQSDVFAKQAALAERSGKPLIIHCVKAWDELIMQRKSMKPRVPWIIHGFRGNGILAQQLLKQGFFLSFREYSINRHYRQHGRIVCLQKQMMRQSIFVRFIGK